MTSKSAYTVYTKYAKLSQHNTTISKRIIVLGVRFLTIRLRTSTYAERVKNRKEKKTVLGDSCIGSIKYNVTARVMMSPVIIITQVLYCSVAFLLQACGRLRQQNFFIQIHDRLTTCTRIFITARCAAACDEYTAAATYYYYYYLYCNIYKYRRIVRRRHFDNTTMRVYRIVPACIILHYVLS